MTREGEPVVSALTEVWSSLEQACEGIAPAQWRLATACPGWSVQDHVSHLIGIERTLLGDKAPPRLAEPGAHVHNEIGELNEAWVAARRERSGEEVLREFREVTGRRLRELQAMNDRDFEREGWSPIGSVPYRRFMWLRVMDSWVHEQDVRAALQRPGGRGGAGERETLDRTSTAMPYVVGRKVRPPRGTVVRWEVSGPLPRTVDVAMVGERAQLVTQVTQASVPHAHPAVTLRLDAMTYWRLGCGRVAASESVSSGAVTVAGDADLGRRVLDEMPFMI